MRFRPPRVLFGRRYRSPAHPAKARMKTMWHADLPLPPEAFDVDSLFAFPIPIKMYMNDVEGDCVIAARANHQVRFLAGELGGLVDISDHEVLTEYLKETGGEDNGLVPEDAMNSWKANGWVAGGRQRTIAAWGRVDATDKLDVQRAVWLLGGMQLSLQLPRIWETALDANRSWDVPPDKEEHNAILGTWGGHQVYVKSYDAVGVTVLTWGAPQVITWAGLAWAGAAANLGEAQAIVRADDGTVPPVDGLNLQKLLMELAILMG